MALVGFRGRSVTTVFRNACNAVYKTQFQQSQRMFRLGEARLRQDGRDTVPVEFMSKVALVVDGKYKSIKEVPEFLPFRTVCKARDKFRVKVAIGTAVVLTIFGVFVIKKNQRRKNEAVYELMQ